MDGIERDLGDRAQVIRLSVVSKLGNEIAGRYGVRGVPTLLIFDGEGNLAERQTGIPSRQEVVARVNAMSP